MTLVLKLDLDIVKMYHHTKNEVALSTALKVLAETDRQTHTHRHTHTDITKTLPHTQEVIITQLSIAIFAIARLLMVNEFISQGNY